ncbi:ankyrin repeat domain-containing protein 50-like [Dendronephthya gigantea]|uniref:ankyrin repeat domain-containing protein 50-like n=1 Tax=Dendronephthya gigantea TaxID=151771 RepID=UPI00106C40ED|nr:ankyrin repeat domain-containing protein 50-like [Dendronephthya gigantea]
MSDTPVEETELLIFDQGDSILPQSTESSAPLNGNDNHTRVQDTAERPPDDNGPVENNEIALPGTGSPFLGIKMPLIPLQPARPIKSSPADEIDNENKRWLGLDGEEEPQHSIENPIDLEDVIQPCPDDSRPVNCCCLNSTSYLEKKQKDLFFAVNYHEEEKVKKILAEEEFHTLVKLLTKRDANGLPCVMRAIMRLSCIQILLDCINGFPDHEDKMMALQSIDGRNVFHFAAQEVRNHELIKSIETSCPLKKELVDDPDDCGTTPLMLACHFNNHAMVRTLVRLGAKIDHVNKDGYSPIYRVTASGSAEILQLFLVEGSRKATNQSQLFTNSELYKGGTILQAILESSSSEKSEKLRTCMNVQDGREHIIQCLKIELKRNKSFIHKLCETPLVELVELAIEENDEKDMVFRKTDERGNTPLIRAIEAKQFGVVRLILSTPCGIRTLTEKKVDTKETALMIACKKGFEIVEFMLETSTDTDLLVEQDRVGRNAFHHAAKNDTIFSLMIDVCKRTERYNAYKNYLNQKDTNGFTPLHYAATAGSYKIVKLLLGEIMAFPTIFARQGKRNSAPPCILRRLQ